MLVFYRLSGVNAIVALVGNLIILLGAMSYIDATMTLPGIAGFVLTMGMGVDSNVLIFERIKEEMEAGRGVRASINAGFTRVFLTLVDTHLSALIGAAFLFQFGTGPIRGFATTLFFGLVSNLFTSTFVSKTLFEVGAVAAARRDAEHLVDGHADLPQPELQLRQVPLARADRLVGDHPGRRGRHLPEGAAPRRRVLGRHDRHRAVRHDAAASTRSAARSTRRSAAARTWWCSATGPSRSARS